MRAENLLEAIGEIQDEAIRDARIQRKPKVRKWVKPAFCAACLCLMAITAFAISHMYISKPMENGYVDAQEGGSLPELQKTKYELSPVYYNDLKLSGGEQNEEALGLSESAMMDIKAFDESMLSQDKCCMIIEGNVVNLYVKHYAYDVYSDKFEKNGILHGRTDTVVYEIAVDKTWYGEDVSGTTILVEDTSYFTEPIFSVKKGMRYVVPLYQYGESIWTGVNEYAGGDITRDSCYSTIYPYHPQIEVTDDGFYLISQDWTTLTAKNTRKVIIDMLEKENYYQDKMCLVDGDTFAEQMEVLVNNIK